MDISFSEDARVLLRAQGGLTETDGYSGAWLGNWPWGATHILIIVPDSAGSAEAIYAVSKTKYHGEAVVFTRGAFEDGSFVITFGGRGTTLTYTLEQDGRLKAVHSSPRGERETILRRVSPQRLLEAVQ